MIKPDIRRKKQETGSGLEQNRTEKVRPKLWRNRNLFDSNAAADNALIEKLSLIAVVFLLIE